MSKKNKNLSYIELNPRMDFFIIQLLNNDKRNQIKDFIRSIPVRKQNKTTTIGELSIFKYFTIAESNVIIIFMILYRHVFAHQLNYGKPALLNCKTSIFNLIVIMMNLKVIQFSCNSEINNHIISFYNSIAISSKAKNMKLNHTKIKLKLGCFSHLK
jgi:hypothetical protein